MRILYIYLLLFCGGLPGYGQLWHPNADFEIPNTFNTKIGDTPAELLAAWNDPHPDSAGLMADLGNGYTYGFVAANTTISPEHCIATNSDPLKTVTFDHTPVAQETAYQITTGWNVLHIPDSCSPPTGNDGLASIINTDDPDYVWTFYRLRKTTPGGVVTWKMSSVHKWCRTRACADADEFAEDGRATGINPIYLAFSGANSACPNTAVYPMASAHLEDFVNAEIPHVVVFAQAERGLAHTKAYPCQAAPIEQQSIGACFTGSTLYHCTTEHPGENRPNAPVTGERIMLDPTINVDLLDIGVDAKTLLKAMQQYGYMMVDGAEQHELSFIVARDARNRDFGFFGPGYEFATTNASLVWLFENSRRIHCVDGWPGECAGLDPPISGPEDPPVITTSVLEGGTLGLAYAQTLGAVGGTTPYVWFCCTAGALPTGLSLNTSTGEISGTPSASATYNFTVRVTDAASNTDTQALSVDVPAGPEIRPPVIPGGITIIAPSVNSVASRPATISFQWVWEDASINSGTVTISASCNDGPWDVLATPAFDASVVDGVASVTLDPETLRIGACSALTLELTAPRDGTNWGSSIVIALRGQYIL